MTRAKMFYQQLDDVEREKIFEYMAKLCPIEVGLEDDCCCDVVNSYNCFECWMKEVK